MSEIVSMVKAFENFGIAALMVSLIYKLADKWAPKFLTAQQETAVAMTGLARAVSAGLEKQDETLIAVRVLARDMADVKGYMRDMAEGRCRAS